MRPRPAGCCQVCAPALKVPEVRTFTDTTGYTYHLCARHFANIERMLRGKEQERRDRELARMAARLERVLK